MGRRSCAGWPIDSEARSWHSPSGRGSPLSSARPAAACDEVAGAVGADARPLTGKLSGAPGESPAEHEA